MKKLMIPALAIATLSFAACNNSSETETTSTDTVSTSTTVAPAATQYVDLNTGNPVEMKKDESGHMVSMATGEPVEFYVDMNTRDTFYGKTGTVVNNAIMRSKDDTKYELDGAKAKWDGNELKIEYADGSKVKADEDEYKYKSGDGKTKVKIDGDDKKIKTPDQKIKMEAGEPTKVKNR
jgi:hypothetical protein